MMLIKNRIINIKGGFVMKKLKIGFIGFGNMAQAMVDGLLSLQLIAKDQIYASARRWEKLSENCTSRGIHPVTTFELVNIVDIVVIAVKPYLVAEVIQPIKEQLHDKLVISVAAGMDFAQYEQLLLPGTEHISTIPNTPMAIGQGIMVTEAMHSLSGDQLAIFETLFSPLAQIEYVNTELLGIASVIAGCGPAFVDVFIEALGDAGVRHGLPRAQAYRLAAKMIAGASSLQLATGRHPGELKDAVCSPKGTTIIGVNTLEEEGFRRSILRAVHNIMTK